MWVFCFFVTLSSSLHILDATYKWYHAVSVSLCLTCFTKHNALRVHPGRCRWRRFLLLSAEQCSIVRGCCVFFVHSSAAGHLGCVHISAIVNNAAGTLGCLYLRIVFLCLDIYTGVRFWAAVFLKYNCNSFKMADKFYVYIFLYFLSLLILRQYFYMDTMTVQFLKYSAAKIQDTRTWSVTESEFCLSSHVRTAFQ